MRRFGRADGRRKRRTHPQTDEASVNQVDGRGFVQGALGNVCDHKVDVVWRVPGCYRNYTTPSENLIADSKMGVQPMSRPSNLT